MSGNQVSKTGLIASPRKKISRVHKIKSDTKNLIKCASTITKPVQFSLRPFGGLFNPYSKGCSILCNHPGPMEIKTVVKRAKEMWLQEGKTTHCIRINTGDTINPDDLNTMNHRMVDNNDIPEHIPEEFFRRYTGSDSRPLTPTPTVASGRTRTSTGSHLNARRCFTPEPTNTCAKERKQLILDLRRSHSQETLFWNASSDFSTGIQTSTIDSQNKTTAGSAKQQHRNQRIGEQDVQRKSAERRAAQQQKQVEIDNNKTIPSTTIITTTICINERDIEEDEADAPRRRGKRKKKSKIQTSTFQINQEPETQIATLGPDSLNPSARPSLIPIGNNMPRLSLVMTDNNAISLTNELSSFQSSFINEETLKILRRGLNIDIVEGTFERYMNKALKEALRTIPLDKVNYESDALKQYKENLTINDVDNEKWLAMPRKYTRNSARFSLPINTHDLTNMTPIEYVSKHIWISDYRKQLYKYVFLKFLPEIIQSSNSPSQIRTTIIFPSNNNRIVKHNDQHHILNADNINLNSDAERTIAYEKLEEALQNVLGFHGTISKIENVKELLKLNPEQYKEFNFRIWCGIVAFSERFLNNLPFAEDPCDEVEIADFESLERKFSYINVPEDLKIILNLIKSN